MLPLYFRFLSHLPSSEQCLNRPEVPESKDDFLFPALRKLVKAVKKVVLREVGKEPRAWYFSAVFWHFFRSLPGSNTRIRHTTCHLHCILYNSGINAWRRGGFSFEYDFPKEAGPWFDTLLCDLRYGAKTRLEHAHVIWIRKSRGKNSRCQYNQVFRDPSAHFYVFLSLGLIFQ